MTDVVQQIRRQVCDAQENWRRKCTENKKDEMPFVTLTYAQSIDGSLTAERGKPTLLSGSASMKMTHMLRTLHDGIMVGVGTVIADNPSLNARLAEGKNPQPIIIDTHLRCPTTIKLFTLPTCEKPFIFFGGSLDPEMLKRKQDLEALGARVFKCQTIRGDDDRDHVDLHDAFCVLKQNGINSVMVEGGSAILTSCLQEATQRHFIDLIVVTIAPTFVRSISFPFLTGLTATLYRVLTDRRSASSIQFAFLEHNFPGSTNISTNLPPPEAASLPCSRRRLGDPRSPRLLTQEEFDLELSSSPSYKTAPTATRRHQMLEPRIPIANITVECAKLSAPPHYIFVGCAASQLGSDDHLNPRIET